MSCVRLLVFLSISCLAGGCATGTPIEPEEGFYIGIGYSQFSLESDNFDGETTLVGAGEMDLLPDLEEGEGLRYSIGYLGELSDSLDSMFELSYQKTEHSGPFLGVDFDAEIHTVDWTWKIIGSRNPRARPYGLLGFSFPIWMDIDDALITGGMTASTAELTGFGAWRLGGGIQSFLTRHIFLDLGAEYRWGSYGKADGVSIDDSLDADGWTATFGLGYVF